MYNVIILATKKNIPILDISIPYIRDNLDEDSIKIIANKKDFALLEHLEVDLIDEDKVYEGLSYEAVEEIIKARCGDGKRTGWYLQQFLKMAWCYSEKSDFYVVFDADTIPLHRINYLTDSGKYYLTQKKEYHEPYFDTLNRLFNGEIDKAAEGSFIAENMIIDTDVMKEMIKEINENDKLKGNSFFEKVLYAISTDDIQGSGFSEFETYGNYILNRYPERVELRTLKTLREAMQIISSCPSKKQLDWAAEDYQIISIEASDYRSTVLTRMTSNDVFMKCFKMSTVARLRTYLRSKYRKLFGKQDYVFD